MSASSVASISPSPSLFGLSRTALATRLADRGVPAYRADQIFGWVYQKHHRTADRMLNLPAHLRAGFHEVCDLALPGVASLRSTADQNTHKFVLGLADSARVE